MATIQPGDRVVATRRIGGYYGPKHRDSSIWEDSGERVVERGVVTDVVDHGNSTISVYWAHDYDEMPTDATDIPIHRTAGIICTRSRIGTWEPNGVYSAVSINGACVSTLANRKADLERSRARDRLTDAKVRRAPVPRPDEDPFLRA